MDERGRSDSRHVSQCRRLYGWGALGLVLGLVAGAALTITFGPVRHHDSADAADSTTQSGTSALRGQGDEGATLLAVDRFFAEEPHAGPLPNAVTKGFEASSFRPLTGTANMQDAIYAAVRLDHEYCLVVVDDGIRTAESCGTLDHIARLGLQLTKDGAGEKDGFPVTVTVTWATDGTVSWGAGSS
ncbi:hypothetical protein [Humibacter sp.]|uniref:hypothetical protein n=1 Tax=Humibacter sp. TaxID=1940291 RepID=UPI003F7D844B